MKYINIAGDTDGWSTALNPPDEDGKISVVSSTCENESLPTKMFSCDLEEMIFDYFEYVFVFGDEADTLLKPMKNILDRAIKKCEELLKRKLGSPIESMFWNVVSDEESEGFIFGLIYQHKVENYIIDFAFKHYDFKLAIELDGHDYHKTKKQRTYDAKRARKLSELGWEVIRFTGSEIFKDSLGCALEVKKIIYNKTGEV
jgi:very-short-patch-repair endonuclease